MGLPRTYMCETREQRAPQTRRARVPDDGDTSPPPRLGRPRLPERTLMPRTLHTAFYALALVSVAQTARAQSVDRYYDALARSAEAEEQGDLAAAARPLEEAIPSYPQDHELALKLGWIYFRAGRFKDAERAYRSSLSVAPQSADARLGLGWALVRQERCDEARTQLAPMLEAEDPRAEDALAACASSPRGTVSLFAGWNQYYFPNHPIKQSGTGVLASATAQTSFGLVVQGAFRHVAFTPSASSSVAAFSQQEGYAKIGYSAPSGALMLHGALVSDGSGTFGTSTHVGLSARWSPAGDLLLDASLSLYDDLQVGRIAPSWSIPVAGPLRLIPGAAFQFTSSEIRWSGSLTAALDWPSFSVWAGGKYGEEIRPAYLSQFAVYDIPERVSWGGWAGVRVKLHPMLSLQATYAMDRLRRTDALTPTESDSHAITAGPLFTF